MSKENPTHFFPCLTDFHVLLNLTTQVSSNRFDSHSCSLWIFPTRAGKCSHACPLKLSGKDENVLVASKIYVSRKNLRQWQSTSFLFLGGFHWQEREVTSSSFSSVPGASFGNSWNCGAVMETSAWSSADTCVQLADFLQGEKTSVVRTLALTRDTDIAYRVYIASWKFVCRKFCGKIVINIIVATYHETLISVRLHRVLVWSPVFILMILSNERIYSKGLVNGMLNTSLYSKRM